MIYEDEDIYIEREESEIPWVKIFTKKPFKELSEVPDDLRAKLWRAYEETEREMISCFRPIKINMASFGNYVPRVHIHVMARFENDSFFPEPMWGERQREGDLPPLEFESFAKSLSTRLSRVFGSKEAG